MKAYTLIKNGSIENLKLAEVETPKIKANEVLIKVKAISINPVDAFVRRAITLFAAEGWWPLTILKFIEAVRKADADQA